MGSDAAGEPGVFVGRLADQARRLQREARGALARGEYDRAADLIGDAELLAEDVHTLVDDIVHREADRLIGHAAAKAAATGAACARRRTASRRGWRIAIGASLAIGLALVEC